MYKILWIFKHRTLLFLVLLIIISCLLVKGYFSTAVKEYVRYECTNKINQVIINTINEEVVTTLSSNSLMHVTYNDNKEVVYAYIDTQLANKVLANTGMKIIELTDIFNTEENSSLNIPLGYLFSSNVFFANGITVPISVSNIASYNVKLDTVVEEYGINASLVTVNLVFDFSFKAMIPLITNDVFINNKVPLLSTVLYGDVPNYFFSGEAPSISVS